jgi:hypothetical protein
MGQREYFESQESFQMAVKERGKCYGGDELKVWSALVIENPINTSQNP